MSDKRLLYIPQHRLTGKKSDAGLYIDAVVMVENTGFEIVEGEGMVIGLVTRVYPDDEPATDRSGDTKPWSGERPFIDAIAVVQDPGSGHPHIIAVNKIAWAKDVERINKLHKLPGLTRPGPQYRIVSELRGIE